MSLWPCPFPSDSIQESFVHLNDRACSWCSSIWMDHYVCPHVPIGGHLGSSCLFYHQSCCTDSLLQPSRLSCCTDSLLQPSRLWRWSRDFIRAGGIAGHWYRHLCFWILLPNCLSFGALRMNAPTSHESEHLLLHQLAVGICCRIFGSLPNW